MNMLNDSRHILHVDMDAFFVSVEEVLDPSLKGKAVVVGGDPDGRGVVATASYAARKFGIHSAMPMARARRLCPQAVFLRGSHRKYAEFSEKIFDLLEKYSPAVEPMSLDEAYMDLTGCQKLQGPVLPTAERIRNEIRSKVGINASIGIASNKLLAKIGSDYAKPNGMFWVAPGMEEKFLAPLLVGRIPGIGKKSSEEFRRLGIKTVGELAMLPKELLEEVLFEKILEAQPHLERFLPFIAVTAATSPLLGLLGTVTGMIRTFQQVTLFGTSDVSKLASGISEALVTTKFGLIAAIPALVLHALLARRVQGLLAGMEKFSTAFVNGLERDRQ